MHDRNIYNTNISRARWRKSFSESPIQVFYELNRPSDRSCPDCCEDARHHSERAQLTTAESRKLIDQLTEFPAPPMLAMIGGDPLQRPDVFELIEYAVDLGLDVSITPRATTLVTRDVINRFRYAGLLRMAINIDGADARTHLAAGHDEGSFRRSLQILRDAQEIGLETQVNTTLSPHNVDQIEAMADRFAVYGIALWSVSFLVPVGRHSRSPCLSAEQNEVAFEQLWLQSQRQPFTFETADAPHFRRYLFQKKLADSNRQEGSPELRALRGRGINDGQGVMFVGHTGRIQPGRSLSVACGFFPLQNVAQVYQESLGFKLMRDSNQLQGKCGVCEFRNICGGSRARAYAVTGDWMAQEPDCNYLPAAMTKDD